MVGLSTRTWDGHQHGGRLTCINVWRQLQTENLADNVTALAQLCALYSDRSEVFCLHSRYNNVNYGAWHVYKALFGSPVATWRLACSEISLSINEKKLERRPNILALQL